MSIVHVRIDDRLIHGQITVKWVRYLRADTILIVNDETDKNPALKMVCKMAAPSEISVEVLSAKEAADKIKSGFYDKRRVFVICKYPRDAANLVRNGVNLEHVNLGNMSGSSDAFKITPSIYLQRDQVEDYKFLAENGVKLTAQMMPDDKVIPLMERIKELGF
ncbi:MAG: PTS sugar transporter subunit IIB [Candidatus Odinarchaeota archaeon]|nr:PTS sugar transporter subunit IIB [Candidatus Odinarchaeota archaeon]